MALKCMLIYRLIVKFSRIWNSFGCQVFRLINTKNARNDSVFSRRNLHFVMSVTTINYYFCFSFYFRIALVLRVSSCKLQHYIGFLTFLANIFFRHILISFNQSARIAFGLEQIQLPFNEEISDDKNHTNSNINDWYTEVFHAIALRKILFGFNMCSEQNAL